MITKFNFKDRTIKSYAIRKLTPFECFRLMGVRDAVIHIMQSTVAQAKARIEKWIGRGIKSSLSFGEGKGGAPAISASQQYKQAGNSIVVDVLAAIYEQLWYPKPRKPKQQLDMFDTLFADEALPPYPKGYDPMEHWIPDGKGNYSPRPSTGEGLGVRVFTTFSGYDSQLMACDALREHHPNFRWTCAGWSDIDKYACQMHNLIFPNMPAHPMNLATSRR